MQQSPGARWRVDNSLLEIASPSGALCQQRVGQLWTPALRCDAVGAIRGALAAAGLQWGALDTHCASNRKGLFKIDGSDSSYCAIL